VLVFLGASVGQTESIVYKYGAGLVIAFAFVCLDERLAEADREGFSIIRA
jgi:hypothetical protein